MKRLLLSAPVMAGLLLGGCSNQLYNDLPRGEAAYRAVPVTAPKGSFDAFLLIPGDELTLNVVAEPDLNILKLVVDNSGNIQVPFIGQVEASGHSTADVARMIEKRLSEKYIKDPHVALNMTVPAQRNVSVEGQVTKAGVFPVSPDTTLLSAIAMAESTSKNARLDEVVVFRVQNGERLAARFDLERIRAGVDPDPQLIPGDSVVVGFSQAKAIYHDFIAMAPFFNIFSRF